ncbi:hypothetical protein IW261DRAFT_1573391 [Armillaria novae-zelandiae]|uniref:Zn(2)-C6 fungal-type domain-containing protein n=1 Tax=Armillaria novae-zelandiae TaxID=153914 RepID=A0AA39NNK2_9AGAR|nr:hypothetical protein IW261DRAFT_1573391 [Armillaria novae-zelandiae]
MAPSYVEPATFHAHEATTFVSLCADLLPGCSSSSLTTDAWIRCAFKCWSRLAQSFRRKDLIFSGPIEWLEFQLVLWAALQQIAVDDVRSSGEEYNFLVAEALKCGVAIDPIPELLLVQYAAEAAAFSAPLSFGGSPLVPGRASDFPSPCPPSPTPFALPPLALSPLLATPSPGTLKLLPPSSSSSPFAFVTLPSFPRLSVSPVTSDDYMVLPSPAMLALASLRRIPPKNFKLAPPPAKLAAPTGRALRSSRSTPAPPPVAGPSKPRKRPLVPSSVDEDGANKRAHLTSPPRLTAAQKGKGRVTSLARITTKQGRSLAVTKDVHKVAVKGGLGEKTPEDAVEVEDPALMPLGLLVPDKDYGDFVGCDGHYFRRSLGDLMVEPCDACSAARAQCRTIRSGSGKCFRCAIHKHACLFHGERTVNKARQVFVPHPALIQDLRARFAQALEESVRIANYQGKVPAALRRTHAENVENLSGLFELGIKEWKDLVDVDAEVVFEAEGLDEDEDEDEDESS